MFRLRRKPRWLVSSLAAAVLGVPLASTADAEDATTETKTEYDLDDLVELSLEALLELKLQTNVATFFDQSWLESPATVELVTESNWRLRGSRRMLDAISHLPSVVTFPSLWGADVVAIRGYTPTVRGIAMLVDGVPVNEFVFGTGLYYPQGNFQLPALSRIEVVRGPGSAVYGSDAFHGVFSLQTFAPTTDQSEASTEIGSDRFHRGYVRASQGLGEEFRVSAVASYSGQPDQDLAYSYTDADTGATGTSTRAFEYQSLHGQLQVRYDPDHPVDAAVAVYGSANAADEFPSIGRSSAPGTPSLLDRDTSKLASQFYMARANVGADLPAKLRFDALGYGWLIRGKSQINGPTAVGPVIGEHVFSPQRAGTRLTLKQDLLEQLHSQWLVGYELSRSRLRSSMPNELNIYPTIAEIDPLHFDPPGTGASRNVHSAFLSAETRVVSDIVRLHYGGRLDWFSDRGDQGYEGFEASPRLAAVVAPNDELAFKALYGRAFRPPTAAENAGVPLTVATSPDIEPERLESRELVAQLQRETFRVGLTGFMSRWRNSIRLEPAMNPEPGDPPHVYANGGNNSSKGLEATFAFADKGFRIDAGASLVRSTNDETGLEHSAFPTFIGNLGVGYRFGSPRVEVYLFQRLLAGMTEGAPDATLPMSPDLPPFYQVNIHAAWEAVPDRLEVFADFRNALARDNRLPSTYNAEGGYAEPAANISVGLRGKL